MSRQAGKVTLQHVADEVGVSRMTVSNAFNRPEKLSAELRERILDRARVLGYAGPDPAARALARGHAGTVGLVITDAIGDSFRDPVSVAFIAAVGDALADRSLALTLITADGSAALDPSQLPMDGAVLYVCGGEDLGYVESLQRRGTPLVTVDQVPVDGVPAVNVDDVGGARAAAQHLLDLGHRRVALMASATLADTAAPPVVDRDLGWSETLVAGGAEVVRVPIDLGRDEAAYDAALAVLGSPARPTGVLCHSDVVAANVIRAAADLGLGVPEDVSVVGYDDAAFASTLRPPLSTVRQSFAEKGKAAVVALDDLLAGREPARMRTVIATELVVRESTGPAPA